jgi:hypothetical protein
MTDWMKVSTGIRVLPLSNWEFYENWYNDSHLRVQMEFSLYFLQFSFDLDKSDREDAPKIY